MGGEFLIGATAGLVSLGALALLYASMKKHLTPSRFGSNNSGMPEPPSASLGPVERLSFMESLDSERFATAAEAAAKEFLARLWCSAFDGATVTLNGVRLLSSRVEMIVTASKGGRELMGSGLATVSRHADSGRLLPVVVDVKTGKAIELMKEAPAARRLAQLTALSSMIVGAAHIIASADIAKKLKIIDGKLDTLLAYRRLDQAAALER
ncbi:MAG TPA: hypothetical protein VGF34_05685, partial [Stellaceae bacterium]